MHKLQVHLKTGGWKCTGDRWGELPICYLWMYDKIHLTLLISTHVLLVRLSYLSTPKKHWGNQQQERGVIAEADRSLHWPWPLRQHSDLSRYNSPGISRGLRLILSLGKEYHPESQLGERVEDYGSRGNDISVVLRVSPAWRPGDYGHIRALRHWQAVINHHLLSSPVRFFFFFLARLPSLCWRSRSWIEKEKHGSQHLGSDTLKLCSNSNNTTKHEMLWQCFTIIAYKV